MALSPGSRESTGGIGIGGSCGIGRTRGESMSRISEIWKPTDLPHVYQKEAYVESYAQTCQSRKARSIHLTSISLGQRPTT